VLAVLFLSGCDILFQLPHIDGPDAGPPGEASIDAPARCKFADNFDDNQISPKNWRLFDPTQGIVKVTEEGQRLVIRPAAFMDGYNGVESINLQDVRGKSLAVEVSPANEGGYQETSAWVIVDADNYLLIGTGAGSLPTRIVTAGVQDQAINPYDPVAMRFWQMRHDAVAGVVYFETSPDGATPWRLLRSVVVTFNLEAATIRLWAGTYQGGMAEPGEAHFDNFVLCDPP